MLHLLRRAADEAAGGPGNVGTRHDRLDQLPPSVRSVLGVLANAVSSREPAIHARIEQLRTDHPSYNNHQLALHLIRSTRRRVAATGALSGAVSSRAALAGIRDRIAENKPYDKFAYDAWLGDGGLRNGRLWAETKGDKPGAPDGMKLDSAGNVYCCGPGGIHVFAPDATCLGVIRMPEHTTNFCFGDDDLRSLCITASTSIYRLRVNTPSVAQYRSSAEPLSSL